jgi:SET domain-containing protein
MLHIPGLYIAPSENRGRGMFTAQPIAIGDIIEVCPVVVLPSDQKPLIDKTLLYDYYFLWNKPKGAIAIVLGYGSIYNHSETPNAEIFSSVDHATITIKCIQPIVSGEEIFVNYQGNQKDSIKLWFNPV